MLRARRQQDAVFDGHIDWALEQQLARRKAQGIDMQPTQKNA